MFAVTDTPPTAPVARRWPVAPATAVPRPGRPASAAAGPQEVGIRIAAARRAHAARTVR